MHRQQEHVRPDAHSSGPGRYRGCGHERRGQVSIIYEMVLGDPGPRKTQPLSLFDLLQTLGIEPRVVPERQPLPEVVPQPERRSGVVPYQSVSSGCAHAPSLQETRATGPRSVADLLSDRDEVCRWPKRDHVRRFQSGPLSPTGYLPVAPRSNQGRPRVFPTPPLRVAACPTVWHSLVSVILQRGV
jgi:hypothetical protein